MDIRQMPNQWKPRPYQLTALSYTLANRFSGLFLDPGLGKTATLLSAIRILRDSGESRGVLIVAPLRVVYSVWPAEIAKWLNFTDLSITILHGKTKSTLWKPHDIYIINPEGLPWLHDELLAGVQAGEKCPFDTLVIDESTRFANPKVNIKKSRKLTRFGYLCNMLPLFKRRHIMTGTPAAASLLNLWSQLFILDRGDALGVNFYRFRRTHFHTTPWNKYEWLLNTGGADKIHQLVAPCVLNMVSDCNIQLPEITYNDIVVTLPSKVLAGYRLMETDFFSALDDDKITASTRAEASLKCHQMSNGAIYEDIPPDIPPEQLPAFKRTRKIFTIHGEKVAALQELVNELNGKPLLIAYHFKHDLIAIKQALGADIPFIGSGVSPAQSTALVKDWNAGKLTVLAGQPVSMSHGLNMQGAGNDICWFSLPHSLENYIQFNKRIHRSGVKNAVRIHHIISDNTLDLAIMARLGKRAKQQTSLREAIDKYRKGLYI